MEVEFSPNDNSLTQYYSIIYSENIIDGENQGGASYDHATVKGVELNENLEHINDIKHRIRDIMLRNSITEYVVTRDRNSNNKIHVMKRTGAESVGIFHCRHCAMEFDDEIQLSSHLRMHYLV